MMYFVLNISTTISLQMPKLGVDWFGKPFQLGLTTAAKDEGLILKATQQKQKMNENVNQLKTRQRKFVY
jgi:hypothetical protein